MVLVDLNQVMISNMMMQLGSHHNAHIDTNILRHMVLNTLRHNKQKFKDPYGEMIICADDKNYWRRSFFPYYKASRKKSREESEIDWKAVFEALNMIREELKEYFPYKVIQIDTAEADDIIGTIVHREGRDLNMGEPILILSGDKDYIQLHTYANVHQFDPTRKRWITHSNPEEYLFEHIVKGDRGDGIPNILSSDNCLVIGQRQGRVTQKRIEEARNINSLSEQIQRNFKRNKALIDLSEVPSEIQEKILEEYLCENDKDRSKLFNYFIAKKLRNLMENINEF